MMSQELGLHGGAVNNPALNPGGAPPPGPELTETERQILSMVKENTGVNFLDSGGAYGRNWERNQGRDFGAEPDTLLSFSGPEEGDLDPCAWEIDLTFNLFKWLCSALGEYLPEVNEAFKEYADLPENADDSHLSLMETFPYWYAEKTGRELKDAYRGGTVNTYNNPDYDFLPQVLQYHLFAVEDRGGENYQEIVLLQVHGGCDVRGGYTTPKAFAVYDDDTTIFDNGRAVVFCEGAPQKALPGLDVPTMHLWHYDGAYYSQAAGEYKELSEFQATGDPELKGTGLLYIDPDGHGYCPLCGGLLKAGW